VCIQTLPNHNGGVEGEDVEVAGVSGHEGEEHDFGDIMIHQVS